MRSLEQIDRWIASKVKHWSSRISGASHSPELLEIRRDILEDIRDRIEPVGGGKSVFPYNTVAVVIAAATEEEVGVRETAFSQADELQEDIRELMTEAGCAAPAISVHVMEDVALAATTRPFRIEYSREKMQPEPTAAPAARAVMKLTVMRGQADLAEYTFDTERVNIGRLKEVVGEKDGLRRRNDVAFADTETTVSREHAQIRYDSESGKFRLYDSGSSRGTTVFRAGRRLEAPRARGVQLRPGDEIHIGDARISFDLI